MAIRNWVGNLKSIANGHQLVLRSMSALVEHYPNVALAADERDSAERNGPVAVSPGALTHASSAKVKFLGVFIGLVDDSKRKRQYEKALEKRRRVIHRLRQLQKQRKESWEKEIERLALNAFTRGYRKTLNTLRSGSKAKQVIFDKATELGMKAALTLTDQHPLMTTDDLKRLLEQEEDHFGRLGWDYLPVSVKTAYENLMLSIEDACEELKAEAEASRSRQALPPAKQYLETRSADEEQSDFHHPNATAEPEVSGSDLNVCCENVMGGLTDPDTLHAAYERIKSKLQLLSGKSDEDWHDLSLNSFDHMAQKLRSGTYQFSPVSQIHVRTPGKEGAARTIVVVSPRDQIVAEAVRAELERIYEPVFMMNAHRYKLARSCHMALKMIKNSWKGTTWFIHYKSPIVFGRAQHENLLRILSARIKDEEFLYLLEKIFKTSMISLGDHGSRLSALLCNIYYHQLDMEVTRMQAELNTGSNKRKEIHLQGVPYARVRYVRYGDEFLFGITGSKPMALDVLGRVQKFLRRELKLHGP
ncbi:hypothetical protein KC19_9G055100 [Ceratodon purpureus]|uniref:Reverse transcriptase domain-containing protein n=1 Tax=Ceratodon purpureus TaxID=3225 RepID=A0A8T0GQW4_CERPU|nr:hypothetical protein KC19_9G055100 [Ceratodon purpureus]